MMATDATRRADRDARRQERAAIYRAAAGAGTRAFIRVVDAILIGTVRLALAAWRWPIRPMRPIRPRRV